MTTIEIVKDLKKQREKDNKYIYDVAQGKRDIDPKKTKGNIIMTPEVFSSIFSPERMKLLLKIRKNHIKNIYQLAKDLGRKYEAVYRDIKYLEGHNIIKIKSKNRKKIPYMGESLEISSFQV